VVVVQVEHVHAVGQQSRHPELPMSNAEKKSIADCS
jgi:hypothetical protein